MPQIDATSHSTQTLLYKYGLNTPKKRTQLLYTLQKSKAYIALLQEKHFRTDSIPKLHDHHFPTVYHASNEEAKSKGVSILMSKYCPIQITEVLRDAQGRFLFIKGTLHNRPMTIATSMPPMHNKSPFSATPCNNLQPFNQAL